MMHSISHNFVSTWLRRSIFRQLFVPHMTMLIVLVAAFILVMNQVFVAYVRTSIAEDLSHADRHIQQSLQRRLDRLQDERDIFVSGYAPQSPDLTSLRMQIQTYLEEYPKDLFVILDGNREIMLLQPVFPDPAESRILRYLQAYHPNQSQDRGYWLIDDAAYQIVTEDIIIDAGHPWTLVMGQRITDAWLRSLDISRDTDILIRDNRRVVLASTFSGDFRFEQSPSFVQRFLGKPEFHDACGLSHGSDYICLPGQIPLSAVAEQSETLLSPHLDYVILMSETAALDFLHQLQTILLVIGGVIILLQGGLSYSQARKITWPIRQLADAAETMQIDDRGAPLHIHKDDEIGKLARTFEAMRTRIHTLVDETVRSEKLSSVGQMAQTIMHDLNNFIHIIQASSSLIQEDSSSSKTIARCRMINRATLKMTHLAQEIHDFTTGVKQLTLRSHSLEAILNDVVSDFQSISLSESVSVRIENHVSAPVIVDAIKIGRVFQNLMLNAAEAMGANGGEISIRSDETPDGMKVVIADTGPGIPGEILETLFQPFVTHGKARGTGLGLAIVQSIVEQHCGAITASSAAGGGAEFSILLPHDPCSGLQIIGKALEQPVPMDS